MSSTAPFITCNQACRFFILILVLALCDVRAVGAQGLVPSLIFYSEENGQSVTLVAGSGVAESVCAVCRDGNGNLVANTSVSFSVTANTKWSLSSTSATTNAKGQAWVMVSAAAGATSSTVTATWYYPPVAPASQQIQLNVSTATCALSQIDSLLGWGQTPNHCNILWYSSSEFGNEISTASANWNSATNVVHFAQGTAAPAELMMSDTCDVTQQWYPITCPPSSIAQPSGCSNTSSSYTIQFNTAWCDGDPSQPAPCGSNYPPRAARHHLIWVAMHEMGHALGLGHNLATASNPADLHALMYPYVEGYFQCNSTNQVTSDETGALTAAPTASPPGLGYTACP